MTIRRHTTSFLALTTAGILLLGCAGRPSGPSGTSPRLYAADMNGEAKTCETTTPTLISGKVADATIKVGSNGGWCGIPVRKSGQPYDAGLLTARPEHGKVFVHRVGNDTRIDYTPDFGFAGADTFTVSLLPGEAGLRIAVTAVPR
jgi:hypothetical protein